MKIFAILISLTGLLLISFGGYQWIEVNSAQKKSLDEAKTLLSQQKHETLDTASSSNQGTTFSPAIGESVGILHIPRLEADLPIVEGTSEDELEKGVGHYKGTAYPQQKDQIVLSGHRDTVFRRMGELAIGDILTVQLQYGNFSYKITNTEVVDANDRSIIVPTAPKEVLTVTTCYPFSFVGNAPDRYIITALPISKE